MSPLPAIFVSHGAPDLPLHPTSPVLDFLKNLAGQFSQPKAILAVSAHWSSAVPTVSTASDMETIHDFGGFPQELYQLTYPAAGAPELADRVAQHLTHAGFETATHPSRGLDHGAWEPLMLMYPEADIPVTQLSIQPALGTAHHFQLGQALAPLLHEDVLILASGAATHNLRQFSTYEFDAAPPEWVQQFDDWLSDAISRYDVDALIDYRQRAPYAAQNHPTEEHLLPLFVALGAGGENARAIQLHSSFTYGVLSMAAYAFYGQSRTVEAAGSKSQDNSHRHFAIPNLKSKI